MKVVLVIGVKFMLNDFLQEFPIFKFSNFQILKLSHGSL